MLSDADLYAECLRLADEYGSLSAVHSSAMEFLLATQHAEDSAVYSTIRILADATRIDREAARLELNQHQIGHSGQ